MHVLLGCANICEQLDLLDTRGMLHFLLVTMPSFPPLETCPISSRGGLRLRGYPAGLNGT